MQPLLAPFAFLQASRFRRLSLGIWMLGVLLAAGPSAATAAGAASDSVGKVIEELTKEITAWSKDRSAAPPRTDWGHPRVQALDVSLSAEVLDRIKRPIRGCDNYESAYVRWQLLWLVSKMPAEDIQRSSTALLTLFRTAPQPVELMGYSEEEVRAIRRIWEQLPHDSVGYYPFQRHVIAWEKIENAAQRKRLQNEHAKMLLMIKAIDKRIGKHNVQAINVNTIAFGYQDRLAELLIRTGNSRALGTVLVAMDKYLSMKSQRGFALLACIYEQVSDGALRQYRPDDLRKMAQQLEEYRKKYDGMRPYAVANQYRHWDRPHTVNRDLADATFHLMHLIVKQVDSSKASGT